MKKILFASTALLAVGAVSQAYAAEPLTATVGGYMHGGLFFHDDEDGVGILRDGEIFLGFKGSSDNGLTFDGRVELEAFTSDSVSCETTMVDDYVDNDYEPSQEEVLSSCEGGGDQIDENWVRVSGSFGAIKIGGDDSAKGAYANGVIYSPGGRLGYYDSWAPAGSQGSIAGNADNIGIHYDSPNFNGFQFGASFVPNTDTDNHNDKGTQSYGSDNFWAVGATWSGDFNGVGVGVSAAFSDADGSNMENWHVGGYVSASGFKLAGHYEEDSDDSDEFAIGASYSTGPWTVAGGVGIQDNSGSDPMSVAGWVSYAVAPGVTAAAGLEYGDPDDGGDEVLTGGVWMTLSF